MNCLAKNINNLLIRADSEEFLSDMYKICLQKVKKGSLVLVITSKNFNFFSSPIKRMKITKEQMKRFIVINYNTIEQITQKLMDLCEWSLLPNFVVVDVSDLISSESCLSSSPIKSLGLCAASFLEYLRAITIQKNDNTEIVNGLFVVKEDGEKIGSIQLQLLQNLFFYKTDILDDLNDLTIFLETDAQ
ncbi:uncharacterized protein LOC142228847 [Haematobia irritans]|uniref:uncharacterized protein LOC142228847 n=1 Tax=Haematobia irritans TaxID=7368 RepID=UPI003F4F6FA0